MWKNLTASILMNVWISHTIGKQFKCIFWKLVCLECVEMVISFKKGDISENLWGNSKTHLLKYYYDMKSQWSIDSSFTSIFSNDGFNQIWSNNPSFSTSLETVVRKLRMKHFDKWKKSKKSVLWTPYCYGYLFFDHFKQVNSQLTEV